MAKVYPGPEATIKNITSPWTRRKVSTLTRLEMPEKTKVDALTHIDTLQKVRIVCLIYQNGTYSLFLKLTERLISTSTMGRVSLINTLSFPFIDWKCYGQQCVNDSVVQLVPLFTTKIHQILGRFRSSISYLLFWEWSCPLLLKKNRGKATLWMISSRD